MTSELIADNRPAEGPRSSASMTAIRMHAFGGPDVLRVETLERLRPQAGQILVRVHAAGVNAIDWKLRSGAMQAIYNPPLPLTPGCDLAGVVEEVGDGVGEFAAGDAVFGMPREEIGAYAEYIAVSAGDLARKPDTLDFIAAASLPTAALTAWQSLFTQGELAAGQTVLIHGAAGGVGSTAVQLAKAKGAAVIATASTEKLAFVESLGADRVIDYTAVRFEELARDVDLVLDVIGGDTQARSWQTLRGGGVLVSTIPPDPTPLDADKARGVQGRGIAVTPSREDLTEIARLIEQGLMKAQVDTVLPLTSAWEAHRLGESGQVRGKIVLQVI